MQAHRELIDTLQKTQEKSALAAKNTPVEKSLIEQQPKLAQALTWLAAYPDMQGLSERKAAASAGVSAATLRKARAAINAQNSEIQQRLL